MSFVVETDDEVLCPGHRDDDLKDELQRLSIHDPLVPSIVGSQLCPYIYCNTEASLNQLRIHFTSLAKATTTVPVFLDCEGRDLGRTDGKLCLVQLGLEEVIYLVDVIECPLSLTTLKMVLENPKFEKIVWDGRSDYAELWHGHGISLNPVLDLQLVRVYESGGYRRGFINLDGMRNVFSAIVGRGLTCDGIDLKRMIEGTSNRSERPNLKSPESN